jgi:hypothetical protein
LFLLGADKYGRDIFSRMVYGARISLSVGLIGIAITFMLGMSIGGISGYVGGRTDTAHPARHRDHQRHSRSCRCGWRSARSCRATGRR